MDRRRNRIPSTLISVKHALKIAMEEAAPLVVRGIISVSLFQAPPGLTQYTLKPFEEITAAVSS